MASKHLFAALWRFVSWQITTLIYKEEILKKWISGSKFFIKKGRHGITGNYYTGLLDFEEMSFLLHFLNKGDLFIDVGANVGAYTILAITTEVEHIVAAEPIPDTFDVLKRNVQINGAANRVNLLNIGISNKKQKMTFSASFDTINHVVEDGLPQSVAVDVNTLDNLVELNSATILKVDVEGYEWFVLDGARKILSNPHLKAVILEINGSGERYGIHDIKIHKLLTEYEFQPYCYKPFKKEVMRLETYNNSNNTIYLRDVEMIASRLRGANTFKVFGEEI